MSAPQPPSALDGTAVTPTLSWRQREQARHTAGLFAVLAALAPVVLIDPDHPVELELDSHGHLVLGPQSTPFWVGLLVVAFLSRVSYRPRDLLIFLFVPIYWLWVAARVASRLMFLPYRDWPPRPDEWDRMRIVAGRVYVLDPPGSEPLEGDD